MRRIFAVLFVLLLLVAVGASKSREWKQGTLISVDVVTVPMDKKHVIHDYVAVVSDNTYFYTVEFRHPLKTAVRDAIKYAIEKDEIVLLDADGKVRSGRIEKRERASK
jgi:hypothetical protein